MTRLAAEQGLPVLCQKPFCESLEEAQALVEVCDKAGVRLMINENFRWQASYRWASVPVRGLDHPGAEGPELASPPRLEIDGTEGTLALGADGWMRLFSDGGYQEWYFSEDTRPASRAAAQQHFIDCLESGAEFETSGAETLKTMGLVYTCYQSAEENQAVDLS